MKKLILGCMFAVLLAGCQSAPRNASDAQADTNTNTAAVNKEPEAEPEPGADPNIVGGQDGKQVIFVLGVDGMD